MYPQSLQTHSRCQYFDSTSAAASFCALDFLLPNTFKEVAVVFSDTTDDDGRATKAFVVEKERQIRAKRRERIDDFMVDGWR